MRKVLIVVISIALLLLMSCNRGEVYFKFKQIERGGWSKENQLEFVMDSLSFDPQLDYDIELELIYSNLYPFSDLWLTVSHNLTDSIFVSDTLKVNLVDVNGKRLGSGNAGLYQLSVPYKQSVQLDSASKYIFNVSNIMKGDKLVGVDKLGVKVYKSQN